MEAGRQQGQLLEVSEDDGTRSYEQAGQRRLCTEAESHEHDEHGDLAEVRQEVGLERKRPVSSHWVREEETQAGRVCQAAAEARQQEVQGGVLLPLLS
jgi:hypothetical protein